MFLTIAPFPGRWGQAGMLAEDFAKIAHVVKSTSPRHFSERQRIAD